MASTRMQAMQRTLENLGSVGQTRKNNDRYSFQTPVPRRCVQPVTKHSAKSTITWRYNPSQNILLRIQLHGFNVDTDIVFLYRATFDFELFFFTDNLPHTTSEHTVLISPNTPPPPPSVSVCGLKCGTWNLHVLSARETPRS